MPEYRGLPLLDVHIPEARWFSLLPVDANATDRRILVWQSTSALSPPENGCGVVQVGEINKNIGAAGIFVFLESPQKGYQVINETDNPNPG